MRNLIKKILKEVDEWDWIRDIPISVTFEEAIIGRRYRIEPTEVLRDAIFECDDEEWMINSKVVDVMAKDMVSYGDVHCGNINQDVVISLRLKFWGPNYEMENNFWVTPNMVALYEMEGFINEEENPFQWIEEVPTGVELEPNTLYYFEPPLNLDEITTLANRITNSPIIKHFLLSKLDIPMFTEHNKGIKYFVTRDKVYDRLQGWCTDFDIEGAKRLYPRATPVDGRIEFGL